MTNLSDLENKIIECATRREVSADIEAKLHGIEVSEARKIIKRLCRKGNLYQSSRSSRAYWGATFAGYRACKSDTDQALDDYANFMDQVI